MRFQNLFAAGAAAALLAAAPLAQAKLVELTFTNNSPTNATYLTPLWAGFHAGGFDSFDAGAAASPALEALAEDGNPAGLSMAFAGSGVDGVVGMAPIAPGASASLIVDLADDGSNDYLSFAAMVLPSSDFFIGNDDPLAHSIAALLGGSVNELFFDISDIYDAGTEVDDFATSAGNPLFGIPGGQTGPNQGADEGALVALASSNEYAAYLNSGGVDVSRFEFDNYQPIATLSLRAVQGSVPLPGTLALVGASLFAFGFTRRRRRMIG